MLKVISQTMLPMNNNPEDTIQPDWPRSWINENNFEDTLADNLDTVPDKIEPADGDQTEEPQEYVPPEQAQMIAPEGPEVEEILYQDPHTLVQDGLRNHEIIEFRYTTKAGRDIGYRVVEPHDMFYSSASHGQVLVTWDRTVGGIRSFIVGHIRGDGVRYEGANFPYRAELAPKPKMRPVSKH